MVERIDIGNVRGIKGDTGEKGDIGNTPTYDEIKYAKNEYGEYVTIQGKPPFIRCYEDSDMLLCDEYGHLIVDGVVTNDTGTPFDEDEYGYLYKPIDKWLDSDGKFTNSNHELIDSEGDTIKVLSTFIGDILTYLFGDTVAYDKITGDIAPKVADSILSADPTDARFRQFFDELEGDVKYYICEDNPELSIIEDGNSISNTCKYQDENGNIVLQENSNLPATVPLEKNTLYLYNSHEGADTNDIMHYDIYICTKANTIPKKLVDSNDFRIDYNVIDDLKITVEEGQEEDEYDVYLNLYTKGDYGEFYNKTDIDNLFDEKVDDKLGVADGIAELGNNGKVKSSQLPSGIIESSAELTTVLDGKEDISNKVTTLDSSDTHYPSCSAIEDVMSALCGWDVVNITLPSMKSFMESHTCSLKVNTALHLAHFTYYAKLNTTANTMTTLEGRIIPSEYRPTEIVVESSLSWSIIIEKSGDIYIHMGTSDQNITVCVNRIWRYD